MFVSYAQHFEDARLFFALSGVKEGFYIDLKSFRKLRAKISIFSRLTLREWKKKF